VPVKITSAGRFHKFQKCSANSGQATSRAATRRGDGGKYRNRTELCKGGRWEGT
jgi:hypothetical protein